MAGKTQEALLSEVVGLLRKQNQLSTRDRLRESEEAKRQEKIAAQGDQAVEGQNNIIGGAQDFQRRFLAGQAKSFTDSARKDNPTGAVAKDSRDLLTRIANVLDKSADMASKWRLQDRRDAAENKREKAPNPIGLGVAGMKKFMGKDGKDSGIVGEAWNKAKWTLALATAGVIWAAAEGYNLWALKTLKGIKNIGKFMGNYALVRNGAIAFRTSFLAWFGYGKDGKPLAKGNPTKMPVIKFLNIGAVQLAVTTRLSTWTANLKASIYKSVGLGPDGKKLGNRFGPNPHGSGARSMPQGMARGFGKGFFRTVSSRVGGIMAPLLRISAAIAAWTVGASGSALAGTLKTLGGSLVNGVMKIPGVGFAARLIGRILWPVTLLFSLFEGFKAGKAESEKESSNWYTILGEGVGGVLGYLLGGLVDLVKNAAVWLITKGFGLTTDEDGVIQGDGLGVKVLNIIKEFSFMDLIRNIVAAPFHLISNVVGFVGKMFTDADYRAGVWEWVTAIPGRIANWVKGMIPDWARKIFGVEIGEAGAMGSLSQGALAIQYSDQLRSSIKGNTRFNPSTGVPFGVDPNDKYVMKNGQVVRDKNGAPKWKYAKNPKPFSRNTYVAGQMRLFKADNESGQAMRDSFIQSYDQAALNRAIATASYAPGQTMVNNVQVINYEAGKYGNLVKNAFTEHGMIQ